MAPRALDAEIDRLYQLPLDEFTAARNALAKEAGADAARIRALAKPPVAAWAVNQLYWRDRDAWDALVEAAESARRAHKAVLSGRGGDVRAAGKVHDDAVDTALKATLAVLAKAGQPVTDATKQAIVITLRALPGEEPPGRLTRALQPGGFEALAGLSLARGAVARTPKPAPAARRSAPAAAPPSSRPRIDVKALTRARQAAAAATRALRDAENAARRAEFEMVRTKREEERAEAAVEKAREAVKRATSDFERAEAAAAVATRNREAAAKRTRETEKALESARADAESSDAEMKTMEKG